MDNNRAKILRDFWIQIDRWVLTNQLCIRVVEKDQKIMVVWEMVSDASFVTVEIIQLD